MTAHMPATRSALLTPTRTGGPSASPVTLMIPLRACAIASYPARWESGPVWPYPLIEA